MATVDLRSTIHGMSMRRITITMPPEEQAARLAEGSAAAMQVFAQIGPPDENELAEARAVLERASKRATPDDTSTAVS